MVMSSTRSGGVGCELVVAKYDYRAQEPQELDLRKGDRLRLLDDTRNWWKVARLDGAGGGAEDVGYVPSNYVKKTAGGAPVASPPQRANNGAMAPPPTGAGGGQPSSQALCSAVARYDYEPARDDELRLRRDDRIDVLEKSPDGWWRGMLASGQAGWFPSNYVSEQDPTAASTSHQTSSSSLGYDARLPATPNAGVGGATGGLETVLCLYTFRAQNDEELAFAKGDKLTIIDHPAHDPEWWMAVDGAGRTGLVPTNYIQVLQRHEPGHSGPPMGAQPSPTQVAGGGHLTPYLVKQRCGGPLADKPWYYGRLTRQQSDNLLDGFGTDGDFLVRDSESNPGDYSVSLKASTRNKHFWVHVERPAGGGDGLEYKIGNRSFTSLDHLLQHYTAHPIYTSDKTGEKLYLIRPLPPLQA